VSPFDLHSVWLAEAPRGFSSRSARSLISAVSESERDLSSDLDRSRFRLL